VATHLKSEFEPRRRRFEMLGVVDPNHGLVECDVTRRRPDGWLEIRLLDPL